MRKRSSMTQIHARSHVGLDELHWLGELSVMYLWNDSLLILFKHTVRHIGPFNLVPVS